MKKLILSAFFLIVVFTPQLTKAASSIDVVMFYGQGCPHCASMETYLEELKDEFPEIQVDAYEIYVIRENIPLMQAMTQAYGSEISGVPTLFIGEKMITGYNPNAVLEAVEECQKTSCSSPLDKITVEQPKLTPPTLPSAEEEPTTQPELSTKDKEYTTIVPPVMAVADTNTPTQKSVGIPKNITIPAVISGAAVDAINPCAFAVLIIMMTTILASKNRHKALLAGLAFAGSIFISYLLMGLGLFSAIKASGLSHGFYIGIGVLAIIIGLFNLKDFLCYGKWFVMEVPMSWRPKLKCLIRGITSVPGAFIIGFAVSLFLLPCTSGPYIVILGLLANQVTRIEALPLLVLYNAIFVLPMILITLAISNGITTTQKAEAWRQKKLKFLHLIAGLIILGLGITMLIGVEKIF